MDAAELLVYLESLLDSNIPLHKLEVHLVCGDCDRYSTLESAYTGPGHITLDWQHELRFPDRLPDL